MVTLYVSFSEWVIRQGVQSVLGAVHTTTGLPWWATFVKRHSAPVAMRGAEAEADDFVVVVLMEGLLFYY
ncbi:hypothetical protein PF008_g26562 [Phytophthora fragariae]|uniref:Uncharacterized protein n=1 Tax=Phytophthora fragariae TaxID=53985 RepID=A0A6G0QGQ1_9STRA|nr:hypothetical protein PF008_g26562 [Phytophthora fragariae]